MTAVVVKMRATYHVGDKLLRPIEGLCSPVTCIQSNGCLEQGKVLDLFIVVKARHDWFYRPGVILVLRLERLEVIQKLLNVRPQ